MRESQREGNSFILPCDPSLCPQTSFALPFTQCCSCPIWPILVPYHPDLSCSLFCFVPSLATYLTYSTHPRLPFSIYIGICARVFVSPECPADGNSLLRVPPSESSTPLPPGSSNLAGCTSWEFHPHGPCPPGGIHIYIRSHFGSRQIILAFFQAHRHGWV